MGGTGGMRDQRDRGTRPGCSHQGPGQPAGLWGRGGNSYGAASAPGEPALCAAPTPGLWREFSKEAHPKVRLGSPASLSSGIPRIRSACSRGCATPGYGLGGLEAAGAHQDCLGTSQSSIPGLQPSPKGTDTSPSRSCAQHQQKKPQIPAPSLAELEQSLSDCLLTSPRPSDAKPLSEPFCQSDTFRVI